MARPKRNSRSLAKAEMRLLGMRTIDPQLDLGNGFSTKAYAAKIDGLRQQLVAYNRLLADLDALGSEITESERSLQTFSAKILSGIGNIFGKQSVEYERVGGVRRVERIRVTRRLTEAAPVASDLPEAAG